MFFSWPTNIKERLYNNYCSVELYSVNVTLDTNASAHASQIVKYLFEDMHVTHLFHKPICLFNVSHLLV